MEARKARRDAHDRNPPFARKATHGRLAHLQDAGELARGQEIMLRRRFVSFVVHEQSPCRAAPLKHHGAGWPSERATRKMAAPSISTSLETGGRLP